MDGKTATFLLELIERSLVESLPIEAEVTLQKLIYKIKAPHMTVNPTNDLDQELDQFSNDMDEMMKVNSSIVSTNPTGMN